MAIFKLINKYFVKSIVGLVCLFGLPLFFSLLYFAIGGNQFFASFPIISTIGVISVTFMVIPTLIIDLRKSLILKRIGAAKVSSYKFLSILSSYFLILIFVSILYSFILYMILGSVIGGIAKAFEKHDIWSTVYSAIILGVMSISISVLIGILVKNSMIASGIAFIVIFFSIFTSGLLMPITTLRQIKGLEILGYLTPLDWPILMMQGAWGVASLAADMKYEIIVDNVWNLSESFVVKVQEYGSLQPKLIDFPIMTQFTKSVNLIGPYLIVGSSIFAISFLFKWGER